MEKIEKIQVYINTEKGKTVCICHAGNKKCHRECQRDLVSRDKFRGWKATMHRDKFGR